MRRKGLRLPRPPKTRSGKQLRRSQPALAKTRDPGDLSTLDNPNALKEISGALKRRPDQTWCPIRPRRSRQARQAVEAFVKRIALWPISTEVLVGTGGRCGCAPVDSSHRT